MYESSNPITPLRATLVLAFTALTAACGSSYPVPNDRIASSEAAVRGAQEVGAQNEPKAALHLKLAQEDIAQAKKLSQDGDNKRADTLLTRAQSEAELALSLAREASAKAEAQQAIDQVTKLKSSSAP
jgi:hypothetical protein